MDRTPGRWNWHDAFGRLNGKGEPMGMGKGITGDEPKVGSLSRFAFAISDEHGFVIAHCTNALITMSSERSEANARLIAQSPPLLEACKAALAHVQLLGSGQPSPYSNAEMCEILGQAVERDGVAL